MVQRDQVPEEVMDEELWLLHVNALEDALLGRDPDLHSFISQSDADFLNGESVAAGDEVGLQMNALGGEQIQGQAKSTGQYSLQVEWLDTDLNVVRREGVISNREGDVWSNYSLDPKSPYVRVIVVNDTTIEQTIDMTGHYR